MMTALTDLCTRHVRGRITAEELRKGLIQELRRCGKYDVSDLASLVYRAHFGEERSL